jgi:ABC-type Fe3+-hydroxamate transport system substrate-binding protein
LAVNETGITDILGQTFEPGGRFERIVSLVPSLTESLFDLGAGGRVVGRTDYCIHPPDQTANIPPIGGTKNPDLGAILALRPDLVLMDQDENRRADADALLSAGARVFATAPHSVQEALNLLWNLAVLLDITAQAGPCIQTIERAYDWAWGAIESAPPVRVFCPIWRDPWMTFNADTYAHDLLRICGAENVFAGHKKRYPHITLDEVAQRTPDLILLSSEPFAFSMNDVSAVTGHPALAKKPVRQVDGSLLFWPGTRLARALAQLPPLLALL